MEQERPPGTGGRASPGQISRSSSSHKCRFHLGFSLGNFDSAMFARSTHFVNVAVVAVLFEIWPVFYILFTSRLLPRDPSNEDPPPVHNWYRLSALLALALTGLVLVFGSQYPSGGLLGLLTSFPMGLTGLYGLLLALFAALLLLQSQMKRKVELGQLFSDEVRQWLLGEMR